MKIRQQEPFPEQTLLHFVQVPPDLLFDTLLVKDKWNIHQQYLHHDVADIPGIGFHVVLDVPGAGTPHHTPQRSPGPKLLLVVMTRVL